MLSHLRHNNKQIFYILRLSILHMILHFEGNCSLSSTMTGTMSPFHHSNGGTMSSLSPSGTISSRGTYRPSLATIADSPGVKRRSRHAQRLNMGAATDDIHVCIMCLRAIMNNKVKMTINLEITRL